MTRNARKLILEGAFSTSMLMGGRVLSYFLFAAFYFSGSFFFLPMLSKDSNHGQSTYPHVRYPMTNKALIGGYEP